MTMPRAPYGSWSSPITAALVAEGGVSVSAVAASGRSVWWSELRPAEGGRTTVLRATRAPGGGGRRRSGRSAEGGWSVVEVLPQPHHARSQVHEYGGGAWWVGGDDLYFVEWGDQRLWRLRPHASPDPLTPPPPRPRAWRYADGILTPDLTSIVCVRERHEAGGEVKNEIVILPRDGSGEPEVLVGGSDFYSFARLDPAGKRLAWTEWDHPNMPWDGTRSYVADFDGRRLSNARLVAGGEEESIFQPAWSPDGVLHLVSDRTGWWNLYRVTEAGLEPVCPLDADFGLPQWVFGLSTYGFLADGTILCVWERDATQHVGVVEPNGTLRDLNLPYTSCAPLVVGGDRAYFVGASPTEHPRLLSLDPKTGETEIVTRSRSDDIPPGYVSVPEPIDYPSAGRMAHAFFYRPKNADFEGPLGERPPLLVFSHGGPTGCVRPVLNPTIQFFTSRGFSVVDVNYGGSTGYGRAYRRLLEGAWGVVDVEDCANAARFLAGRGDVDPGRLAIRGGSAGGFTTLACLAFTDVFRAGANYFGVSDLETFVGDTHKFESRYLDRLVGPYPEQRDRYRERSPANFVEQITCPVITFQGLEDAIVPPSQSERIVEALRRNGVPHAYIVYEGEQHGFRQAKNIIHSLESELAFYGRVFGFVPDVERSVELAPA